MKCPNCGAEISIHDIAAEIGKKGGAARSEAKTKAARLNAKKGGWPKGRKRKITEERK